MRSRSTNLISSYSSILWRVSDLSFSFDFGSVRKREGIRGLSVPCPRNDQGALSFWFLKYTPDGERASKNSCADKQSTSGRTTRFVISKLLSPSTKYTTYT